MQRMLPNVLQPNTTDHVPVLADEVRELLALEPGKTLVDGTFGAGGHASLLARDLKGKGKVIAIDRDPSVRPYFERFYYSGAVEAQPDKQGRVMLPPALIDHAKLGREVIVIGMRGRIEIWDRAAWRAQIKEVMGSAEHVAERLATQHD